MLEVLPSVPGKGVPGEIIDLSVRMIVAAIVARFLLASSCDVPRLVNYSG